MNEPSNRIIGDAPPDLKRRVDQSQKSEVKVSRCVVHVDLDLESSTCRSSYCSNNFSPLAEHARVVLLSSVRRSALVVTIPHVALPNGMRTKTKA